MNRDLNRDMERNLDNGIGQGLDPFTRAGTRLGAELKESNIGPDGGKIRTRTRIMDNEKGSERSD